MIRRLYDKKPVSVWEDCEDKEVSIIVTNKDFILHQVPRYALVDSDFITFVSNFQIEAMRKLKELEEKRIEDSHENDYVLKTV